MRIPFQLDSNRLIYLSGEVYRKDHKDELTFILDTGASSSVINSEHLTSLGYDLKNDTYDQENIITGGGLIKASKIKLDKILVLGQTKTEFPVLVYLLPPQTMIAGILGNDFLADYRLTIDFPQRWLEVERSSTNL
jgi:hypothetical protein